MKFLNFFKKDSKVCTEENNEENNILIDKDNIKDEEIEMLKKLNGHPIEYEIPQYWTDYINDVDLFIKNVIRNNLLRISTPKEAIKNGADFIVLGRAITKENNKTEVIEKIYKEILNG